MIFVFGSNLAGRHGAGAALYAVKHHGAVDGVGIGPTGTAYAIPTKDERLKTLPIHELRKYVSEFLRFAREHSNQEFYVTAIGTGRAGYAHADIAPLFAGAPPNCALPEEWEPHLKGRTQAKFTVRPPDT